MLKNYLTTALRYILRYKLFSLVNIIGLGLGLATFILSQLFVHYEKNFDNFFTNADRIFIVTEKLSPTFTTNEVDGVHLAIGPLLPEYVSGLEAWARMIQDEMLVNLSDKKSYQIIKFVEPAFLDIFTLDFIKGDFKTALVDPNSVILSASAAIKYFGSKDPIGQVMTVHGDYDLKVTGVFKDLPLNSHLTTSSIYDTEFSLISTTQAYSQITGWDIAGDFDGQSSTDITYILLNEKASKEKTLSDLALLYKNHMPERLLEYYLGISMINVQEKNSFIWRSSGMPLLFTVNVIGVLILIVASLNYANLASAQVMGRTREVGIRRTMGATRIQLFSQFIVESVFLSFVALLCAISMIDIILPLINDSLGKAIPFDYITNSYLALELLVVAFVVGLLAGIYPAYVISVANPSQILQNKITKGLKGIKIRNVMMVFQFTISIFLVIAVVIMMAQNRQIEKSSEVFQKDRIVTLGRVNQGNVHDRQETLKTELLNLNGVEGASYSRLVPFQQSNINSDYTMEPGNDADKIMFWRLSGDKDFLVVYDFKLKYGRFLDKNRESDVMQFDENGQFLTPFVNVVVNEQLIKKMGYENAQDALGKSFYQGQDGGGSREFKIVGIVEDKNFMGFYNQIWPTYYTIRPSNFRVLSLVINNANMQETLRQIEQVWDRINPEYPMERKFLDGYFYDIYKLFEGISKGLAGFAMFAFLVAMIGLFGLAAMMAQKRTKEIGLRKVLGASVKNIVNLLVWQFSRPVLMAVVLASPLAYWAAGVYLDFFPDRVSISPFLFIGVGFCALFLAGLTVSIHAIKAARSNPINSLRYE